MKIVAPKQIQLPTIFGMKTVNAWLFIEPEPTLIDCGEHSEENYHSLKQHLKQYNLSIADIKHLYITHAHVDHIGQASRIQEESECQIYLNPNSYPWATNLEVMMNQRSNLIHKHLKEYLGPENPMISAFINFFKNTKKYWPAMTDHNLNILPWDDTFEMGGSSWKNIHTPGHTITQGVYFDEENQRMISSDMLMSITPTAVIDPDPDNPDIATEGLSVLLESYRLLEKLEFKIAYPGHYSILENPKLIMQNQVKRIHQRIVECLTIVQNGTNRFLSILQQMYGQRISFPAIVMLMGYLQILESEGKIFKNLVDDFWQYRV